MSSPGYLSVTNIDHVFSLCQRFLQERKQVNLPTEQLMSVVKSTMQAISANAGSNPPPLNELNKITMGKVRDTVLAALAQPPSQPPMQPPPSVQPAQPVQARPEPENAVEEDIFFQKLKELEIQRSTTERPQPPSNVATLKADVSEVSPAPVAPSAPILPPTVIVHTNEKRPSNAIYISSRQRSWNVQTQRSTFLWEGDIHNAFEYQSEALVVSVIAPSIWHPVLWLNIEGAGGQTQSCYLKASHTHGPWTYYTPFREATGMIRLVSPPWKVSLCDDQKEPLNLGDDAWIIKKTLETSKGHGVMFLDPPIASIPLSTIFDEYRVNDQLLIQPMDDMELSVIRRVVQVHHDFGVEVDGPVPKSGTVLHLMRQVSLLMEIYSKK